MTGEGAILGATARHSISSMDDNFAIAVDSTARKMWLAGDINMAVGDMLAAERSLLLYTRKKNTTGVESAKRLFADRAALIERHATEFKPLATNDEERNAIDFVVRGVAKWQSIMHELVRVSALS